MYWYVITKSFSVVVSSSVGGKVFGQLLGSDSPKNYDEIKKRHAMYAEAMKFKNYSYKIGT